MKKFKVTFNFKPESDWLQSWKVYHAETANDAMAMSDSFLLDECLLDDIDLRDVEEVNSLVLMVETIRANLDNQGEKSSRMTCSGNACMYRTKSGDKVLMCAIGGMIPDNMYTPEIENHGLDSIARSVNFNDVGNAPMRKFWTAFEKHLVDSFGFTKKEIPAMIDVLKRCQSVHDNNFDYRNQYFDDIIATLKKCQYD